MATVGSDAFTGTAGNAIAGRTADTGGTWAANAATGGNFVITDVNRARPNATGVQNVLLPCTGLASAEFDVSVDIRMTGTPVVYQEIGISFRFDPTADTGYVALLSQDGSAYLYHFAAGSANLLDSAAHGVDWGAAATHALLVECRNASKVVKLAGVEILSSANNTVTAQGRQGLWDYADVAPANGTGAHFDNFLVSDLGGGGGGAIYLPKRRGRSYIRM
jgi:hypothetical protein